MDAVHAAASTFENVFWEAKLRIFMVIFVISAMFLAGCRANNVVENKDAPQDSKNNSETDATKEATTDLNQGLAPISTKTFDGIWKLTTYQNPDSVKKITEWKPKPLEYKGELQKKWSMDAWYHENKKLRYYVNEPYRSYPDCWGIFDLFLCNKENDYYLSGFLNPDTGEFSKNVNSLGITDGENIYVDDSSYYSSSYCVRLSDKKELWETILIGGFCSDPKPVHISESCLINIQDCRGDPNESIRRVNTETGKPVWFLELMDSAQISGRYSISNAESNLETIFIEVGEIFRNPINDEYIDSETKGYYKIKPSDGSVSKVDIDPKYDVIGSVRCGEMILMKTLGKRFLIYNPENDEVVEHDIIKQTGYNVTKDTYMQIYYILENKLLISLSDSIESFQYFTYDFKSKKLTNISKENMKSVWVVNGSLIVEYGNKSECIDPETQETLWTIEYQKTGSVQWLDWRGVLTFQENQLVCYTPK